MEIDIEGFLRSHRMIPVGTEGWHSFDIEHFPDAAFADAHGRIDEVRAVIPMGTSGVYVYENSDGKCIYVGKHQHLRDRFRTHYQRANREDRKGDRNNRHFDFWSARVGKLKVRWIKIDREPDRQIIEIMLTDYLKPEFCSIPWARRARSS